MWGHTYIETNDAFVLYVVSVCCAMQHMDAIDVIVSCMSR